VRKVLVANRPISLIGALFLGFWLIPVSLHAQTQGQKPDDASGFSIAVQAYRDGLLDLARDQLEIYLAAYPQGKQAAEAHYLLGDYFFRKGDFVQVLPHVREALQRQLPTALRDDAHYLLGRSSVETGQYAAALEAFQPLTAPGQSGRWNEEALYWSGQALLSLGDFTSAAGQLQRLIDTYPNSEYLESSLYGLGYAWHKADAHAQSLEAFQLFLQRFPQSPLHQAAAYGVARTLTTLQRFAEAAPHWERLSQPAVAFAEAEEATFWWAESWTRAERCDQALPVWQVYLRRFPQGRYGAEALAALAICAQTLGELATEIAARETFLQQFPADAQRDPMLLRLAEAYEQNARPSHAREIYRQWLALFPDHAQRSSVLIRRGLISQVLGDEDQMIEDFAEVLRHPSDARQRVLAHAVLAQSYAKRDDCTAALPHLSAVIEEGDPAAQQHARWQRGLCAYRNKAFAAAVEDFDRLVDDASFARDRQSLWLLSGQSLAALGRDREAVDRFRRFLAGAPEEKAAIQALAGLGASLLKVGDVEAALPVYEQLLSLAPELPAKEQLHLQLGLLYLERQAPEQAKRHFEEAAQGHDEAIAAEATYRLADRLFAEGLAEEATALLHKLTTQLVSQPVWVGIASYRLALLYEASELWPEAWQAYRRAAQTATDQQLAQAARERAQHLEETVDVHPRREPASSQAERNL
jgi:tetratricopeptide (TPR) repeat protein